MSQGTLFENWVAPPPGHGLARRDDPDTSKEAADDLVESGRLARMERIALDLVAEYPGRTGSELDALSGLREGAVRKRLAKLREDGRLRNGEERVCSVTGKKVGTD